MRRRLIANLRAGRGPAAARALVDLWTGAAAAAGLHADHRLTGSADEARGALADLEPGDRVVLAGGDGSVQALLQELVARRLELAVLPAGSGNDFAAALGWRRRDAAAAITAALGVPARASDLMRVRIDGRETWAASSVTIGLDAAIAGRAATLPRGGPGLARYLAATLIELARLSPCVLARRLDGAEPATTGETLFVSVLNTPTYGGGIPMAPGARIDDGRLDVVFADRFGRLAALAMLPRVLAGRHLGHPRVRRQSVAHVVVTAPGAAVAVAVDGEPCGHAVQVDVEIAAGALPAVFAPSRPAQ